MDFAASAGAAAEDSALSREELQARFNGLKVVLNNIQETFTKGLRDVEALLTKHSESLSDEFQNELSLKTKDIQSQVRTLFLQSPDASRVLQTSTLLSQLQKEKSEWEQQKQQGYLMLESLKEQNRALEAKLASMGVDMEAFNEERQKWEKEKTQGYSLMATYSEELAKARAAAPAGGGGTAADDGSSAVSSTGVPFENPEMEIARLNGIIDVGRQKLLFLTTENQRLTQDKELLEKLHKEAQFVIASNGYKSLYRSATKTHWEAADLDALRKDMEKEMKGMKDAELRKQFEAEEQQWRDQEELSTAPEMHGTGYIPGPNDSLTREHSSSSVAAMSAAAETLAVEAAAEAPYGKMVQTPAGGHLFRPMTKTDWDAEQLAKLKDELTSEMQTMHKQSLQALMEKQDRLRYDKDEGAFLSTETDVPAEVVPSAATISSGAAAAAAGSEDDKKEDLGTARLRDAYGITEDQTDSEEQIQKLREEMRAQLAEMNKQTLFKMTERQMQVPEKSAEEKLEEKSDSQMDLIKSEMVEALNQMTKQSLNQMFEKQMELRDDSVDPTMPVVIDPSELASMNTEDRLRNLIRMQSTAGWTEEELAAMRADIEDAMQETKKQGLLAMMAKQDEERYPATEETNLYDHPEYRAMKTKLDDSEDKLSDIEEEMTSLKSELERLNESLKQAELSKIILAETTAVEMQKLRKRICDLCSADDGDCCQSGGDGCC